jgi:hypothetical protein
LYGYYQASEMKKLLLLLVVILSTGITKAQDSFSKDQLAVQQTVHQLFDALSNRNEAELRKSCTQDVRFYEYGKVWTLDTLITKAITKNTDVNFKRVNTITFISTTIHENSAWATYRLQSEIINNNKQRTVNWLETVILVNEDNHWKIKVLHSTSIQQN